MRPAGERTERVVFSRLGVGQDEYGETNGSWGELGAARAAVFWGSGAERREAARASGSQAASFVVLSTALTRGVTLKDRLAHGGADWDIKGIVPRGRSEIEFNCVRSA